MNQIIRICALFCDRPNTLTKPTVVVVRAMVAVVEVQVTGVVGVGRTKRT